MTAHTCALALILVASASPDARILRPGLGPQPIVMRDLGFSGHATALNDRGDVAGRLSFGTAAVFWSEATGPVLIHPLPGHTAIFANDINNRGEVVGYSYRTGDDAHAFIWSQSGGLYDLGPGAALAINDLGTVVGGDATRAGAPGPWSGHARMWRADGSVVDLGLPSEAYAINNSDVVATGFSSPLYLWSPRSGVVDMRYTGWVFGLNDRLHAFVRSGGYPSALPALWTDAGVIAIDTPGCHDNWSGRINNMDWLVAAWKTCGNREQMHGFVWSPEAGVVDLHEHVTTDIADYDAWAWDVNEQGQIAGAVTDPLMGIERAVVWDVPVASVARVRSLDVTFATFAANGTLSTHAAEQLRARLDRVRSALASGDRNGARHAADTLWRKLQSDLRSGKLPDAESWVLDSVSQLR